MKDDDYLYITDDDGKVVGKEVYRDNGEVSVCYSDDNFATHSHNVYSSMDKYMEDVDDTFAGKGSSGGDVYSRDADVDSDKHPWVDRDGVLKK